MTPDPLTVTPEASIAEVWDTMRELEVRHVPVQRSALVGMLSELDTALRSDSAPVTRLVSALLDAVPGTHVLRDPTRGGQLPRIC